MKFGWLVLTELDRYVPAEVWKGSEEPVLEHGVI
jgi:hypothetical protein